MAGLVPQLQRCHLYLLLVAKHGEILIEMVTALLNQQVVLYGMGNVWSARNVLSGLWSCSTAADYESGMLHWEDLIGKRTNNAHLCIWTPLTFRR